MVLSQVEHVGVEAAGLRSGAAERPVCGGMTREVSLCFIIRLSIYHGNVLLDVSGCCRVEALDCMRC